MIVNRFLLRVLVCCAVLLFAGCHKDDIVTVVSDPSDTAGSDDETQDTTSSRTVTVTFSANSSATVTGNGSNQTVSINGNDVVVRNNGSEKVLYVLKGTANDGYLKIYSGRKQTIRLDNVSIANSRGAAINIQGLSDTPNKGKRTDVVLVGSSMLADGSSYTLTPSNEDEKAALFSEGQIVFSGTGSLTVNATGKSGITSDEYVGFLDGCIVNVNSSSGHGVRGKDYILVNGGTIDVHVSANGKKGFSSDSLVRFNGGVTNISVTGNTVVVSGDTNRVAGIKADKLFEMNDGSLTVSSSGTGGKGISCDGDGYFNGGTVQVTVTGSNFGSSGGGWPGGGGNNNRSVGAKGIKFDGNLYFNGGTVYASASKHEAIESKGTVTISGGEVYAYSSDDAVNSASTMTITGGYVCAHSTGNDGLDANGNCYIQGGFIYVIGKNSPEMAIDANTEGGFRLYVQGGTIVAIGSLENGAQLTQSCYQSSSWNKNVWYSITVGDVVHAFKTPSSGGTKLVVSGSSQPEVKSGVTVNSGTDILNGMVKKDAECTGGNTVSLSQYSSGGGGGGWW
ncbi:MAG: carbohydrate-binding domain-containing protein [Bacteroidales bacterium]|nr:carbohydrate-binding domain-containing protein [Bacteroidales bacterium]